MTTIEALKALEAEFRPLRDYVSRSIEIPEPSLKLNLASRGNDQARRFKHLHLSCMLHAEHFARANQVKLATLVDGYLESCKANNALGPYLFGRTVLELGAFLRDVASRALAITAKGEGAWQTSGEEFFSLMVRARYASSDPDKLRVLGDISKSQSKPINVMSSIAALSDSEDTAFLVAAYDKLCDFVHHNLSSQLASTVGVRIGSDARSEGGGMLMTKQSGPITRYEYPIPTKGVLAVSETIGIVEKAIEISVAALNSMPRTPYSETELLRRTGSRTGLVQLA